jgi:hypothetical protein
MTSILHEKVMMAAANLALQMSSGNYSGIITSGYSGKITASYFSQAWRLAIPDRDMPKITDLGNEGNRLMYYAFKKFSGSIEDKERKKEFNRFILARHPDLAGLMRSRLCYLDDHAKSGYKIGMIQQNLPLLGFKEMEFAVIAARHDTSLDDKVLVGIVDNTLAEELFTFGRYLEKAA